MNTRSALWGWTLVSFALMLAILFLAGTYLPIRVSVAALLAVAVCALAINTVRPLSLLPRIAVLLFALPFAVLAGVFLVDYLVWWQTPAALDVILDSTVMAETAHVGLVGLLALTAGFWLARTDPVPAGPRDSLVDRSLTVTPFVSLTLLACFLAFVAARSSIRVDGYYRDAMEAAISGGPYASLYVLAYAILVALFVDAQNHEGYGRRHKFIILLTAVAYVTIPLQILRGDREVTGLLAALIGLHLTEPGNFARAHARARKMLPIAALAVVVLLAIGQERYREGGSDNVRDFVSSAGAEIAGGGTWTAVLLGNVALAADHQSSNFRFLRGQTYVDYVLSIPPGIVTRSLGIRRAVEAEAGPGLWYYPLQNGGVHPTLVPFRNFGVLGVVVILVLEGILIARVEVLGRSRQYVRRLVYGTFLLGSLNWMWYGELPFIRTLMAATIAWAMVSVLRPRLQLAWAVE